jgi:hypothetical protein
MKRGILIFIIIIVFPVYAGADYTVFLKNGAVVENIKTYVEKNEELIVFFKDGSMSISRKDILKVEGSESLDKDLVAEDGQEVQENGEKQEKPSDTQVPAQEAYDEKIQKMNQLRTELDTVISNIRAIEKQEAQLVKTINQKAGERKYYNIIQLRQQEKEIEPLKQELVSVQEKKRELVQKKIQLEDEFRVLQ